MISVWLDINRLKSNARSLSDLKVNNAYYFRVILVVVCTVHNRLLLLPYLLKEQLDLTQWEQKPKQKDKGNRRKVRKNKKQRWLKTHWTDTYFLNTDWTFDIEYVCTCVGIANIPEWHRPKIIFTSGSKTVGCPHIVAPYYYCDIKQTKPHKKQQ